MSKARIGRPAAALWRLCRFREEQNAASSTAVGRGRSRSTPRWLSPGLLAITLVTSLGLSACGSPSASPPSTTSTPSTSVSASTSSPSSTTAPVSAEASAVLDAYRAGWTAVEHATATANPLDPALKETMVNPVLHQVIGNLVTDNMEGIVGKGSIVLDPHVTAIDGTSATVLDCAYSSSFLVYKKTGKQVPPITKPEHDADKATLVLVGSTWKTKTRQITEGSCPAGY
jgi:hypothetical protein